MLDRTDIIGFLRSESDAFAAAVTDDALDRRVPSCPDWSVRDLAWHVGRVQRFWGYHVRSGDTEPDLASEREPGPAPGDELRAWLRASTAELLDALDATPWDRAAWTWWHDDRTVGAIARHQVQEVAVHRWDAQRATGEERPLPTAVADDGVDEFLWIARQFGEPPPIELRALDTGHAFATAPGEPRTRVTATASDLVLLLYGRVGPAEVDVEGDANALAQFLKPIE